MRCRPARDRLFALLTVILILLADILTKRWALDHLLSADGAVGGISGIFHFRFAWNTGVAFSFWDKLIPGGMHYEFGYQPFLVVILTLLVLTAVVLFLFCPKRERLADRIMLAFIFAGGLGNLIDRVIYGAVVDFIEFTFISFPVFNVADICVVMGTLLFCVRMLILDRKKGGIQ